MTCLVDSGAVEKVKRTRRPKSHHMEQVALESGSVVLAIARTSR